MIESVPPTKEATAETASASPPPSLLRHRVSVDRGDDG